MFGNKKKKLEALFTSGSKAVGVVQEVRDTGMTVNDNPRVKMVFRIEPIDGSEPFQAEKTKTVPRVAIPRQGDRYPVWYDPNDTELWAFAIIENDQGREQVRSQFGDAAATMTGMGNGAEGAGGDPTERLQKLNELRQSGAISEFEFEDKKAQILAEL
jgi:hypothetical protein